MARVVFEVAPMGSGIPGGMGGAAVTDPVWVHDDFKKLRLEERIEAALSGKAKRL